MIKSKLCFLLCLMAVLSVGNRAQAAGTEDKATALADAGAQYLVMVDAPAVPEGPYFLVNGTPVSDPGLAVYENTTYVSLREVVLALRPDGAVNWAGEGAVAVAPGLSITARPGDCYLEANGRYLYLPHGVKVVDGRVLVPARAAAQALGASVEWDVESNCVSLYGGTGAIVPGDAYYNSDDVYWLSRIIHSESGNQPMLGKLAVGDVIINRVANPTFPNTVYDVIFERNGNGYQFSPVGNGAINRTPNEQSIIAAKLCLEGTDVAGDSLYFVNPRIAPNSWAQRTRPFVMTIGAHSFYA